MRKHRVAMAGRCLRLLTLFVSILAFDSAAFNDRLTRAQTEDSPSVVGYQENFDLVTPPQLPTGWTTAVTGIDTPFVSQAITPDTAPNSVFTTDPSNIGTAELVSPSVRVGGNSPKLVFRNQYNTESTFDGGVLEISIAGGAFQDILTAGGSFVSGGYNSTISSSFGNPLAARRAWTGTSVNYVTTEVDLPPAAYHQTVQFKWRFGSDNSVAAVGWRVDTVQVTDAATGDNQAAISIPAIGIASPYPSQIDLSGLPGTVTSVVVNIAGLTHTAPDDLDLLLVAPNGGCVMLMSDAGGTNAVTNLALSFDDSAASTLPDNGPLVSGTFKPTDYEPGDPFPPPAPVCSSVETRLGSLFNSQPNGAWKLFAVDDTGRNAGSIAAGWSILVNTSTTAIGIPASGVAQPYPSEITVSSAAGLVTRVTVGPENFSHTSPDDVDLMLVAPNGRRVILMSDAGGSNPVSGVNVTFDDQAGSNLPDNTTINSGTYRPTDFEPGDIFPAPAPNVGSFGQMLASLNGSDPNGVWRLFLVDDNGNNAGTIDRWTLNIQSGPTVISIPDVGVSSPYPAEVVVSGLPGSITKATVSLSNFSHLAPDDVDILLVGPDGRRIVLMSDAGGQTEVGGVNLTFDDAASAELPDNGTLFSGTYRPTDYEPGDVFPSPAPPGPVTGTTLGAFYGGVPNGIWRLYVVDDNGNNFGSIAGSWSVSLQTSTSACLFSLSPTVQAFPIAGGSGELTVMQPNGCAWTATTNQSFIGITAGGSGGGNGTISFSVAPNTGPARTGTIDVSNGVTTRSFQVQQPSGCPLAVSQTTVNFAATGGSGSVNVTAGGGCSWRGSTTASWIQITSSQQSGDGTLAFTIAPNTTRTARSATIDLGAQIVTVNQAATLTTRFDFDGDSRSDISIYRPSSGTWWIMRSGQSGAATAQQFGISTDRIAPADYDGDRKTDIAVYRDGVWYIFRSSDASVTIIPWGTTGDTPVPADYDGDGRAELAVFRPSTGVWWILNSNGTFAAIPFGQSGDAPVPADYDGDGKADLSVYRPGASAGAASSWWILNSVGGSVSTYPYGVNGDIPVPADYDGDGRDNVAVYRPSTGYWYRSLDASRNYEGVRWGISTDRPAPADYDGDGKADPAVMRSGSAAVWYILGSASGPQVIGFGSLGDVAAPSAFIP